MSIHQAKATKSPANTGLDRYEYYCSSIFLLEINPLVIS